MVGFGVVFFPHIPPSFPAFSPFLPLPLGWQGHGRAGSGALLKAAQDFPWQGTLGKHPRPPTPRPRGQRASPDPPAPRPRFPAAAHPAGPDPAPRALLLLRLLPPRLRCCAINKDSTTKNSRVLSQGGCFASGAALAPRNPAPHPKTPAPALDTPTQGCSEAAWGGKGMNSPPSTPWWLSAGSEGGSKRLSRSVSPRFV